MRKRENVAGDSVLVRECEAFLDGTLAEYWDEQGLRPRVGLDQPAGPREQELIGETRRFARPARAVRAASWRIARSYLAYRIFDLMDAGFPLDELQPYVLIPLELEMAALPEVGRWTPRQWVDTVDHAIRSQHVPLERLRVIARHRV